MKRLIRCTLLLLPLLLAAETQKTVWSAADLGKERIRLSASAGHLCLPEVSAGQKTPDGETVLAFKVRTPAGKPAPYGKQINFIYSNPVAKGQKYRLRFFYKGTCRASAAYNAARQYHPYSAIGRKTGRTLEVTPEWKQETLEFTVDESALPPLAIPRFRIGTFPDGETFFLGPVTLERLDRTYASVLTPEWKYTADSGAPVDRIPPDAKPCTLTRNAVDLAALTRETGNGKSAVLYQEFDVPSEGFMTLGMAADWWMECFVNGQAVFDTLKTGNMSLRYTPEDHVFNVPVRKGRNLIAVRVRGGSGGWKFVCGKVKAVDGDPKLVNLFAPKPGKDYRPVCEEHFLEVKPGTALDFSRLIERERPAGVLGRLVIGKNGDAEFEKRPGQPVRLFGFNLALGSMLWEDRVHEWDRKTIDRFCDAIERRGYNYARIQVPEAFLIGFRLLTDYHKNDYRTVKIPQTRAELEETLDTANLDRLDYLLAGLKKRGIYYSFDLAGRRMIRKVWRVPHTESFLGQLFFDPVHRNHWKLFTEYFMNHRNPYTGTAYKDECALVLVNFVNEQDLRFANGLDFLLPSFRQYLKRKYQTDPALAQAWGIPVTFDTVPAIKELHLHQGDQRAADSGDFLIAAMKEMSTFFFRTIREAGYPGLVYHWDMILRTLEFPGRALLPVSSQHTYFAHPEAIPSQKIVPKKNISANASAGNYPHDSMVSQRSSLDSAYVRAAAAARFLDRPYFITEYSHSFLNRYRHERGLYFSAYASLQEWSALAAHSRTVRLKRVAASWFDDANDPLSRANETLAALIYLRRDVRPAAHRVALELRNDKLFPGHYLSAIGDEYAKLAFATRIGILYPEIRPLMPVGNVTPDLRLIPEHYTKLNVGQWFVSADTSDSGREIPFFNLLRERKILPPGNRTDPARKLFESETGELLLNTAEKTLQIVTPRLEGAIVKQNRPLDLKRMSIRSCSRPAAVALAALDGSRDLKSARRILLTVSTNAYNSGTVFNSPNCEIWLDSGAPPSLIESVRLDLSLSNGKTVLPELWALNFDGTRAEKLSALSLKDGTLHLSLDTSNLRYGTVFFELVYPK